MNRLNRVREFFRLHPLKATLFALFTLVVVGAVLLTAWVVNLDHEVAKRFAEKRFAPPIEFYSAAEKIAPGDQFPASDLEQLFVRKTYTKREFQQSMAPGDYAAWTGDECRTNLGFSSQPVDPALDQSLAENKGSAYGPESIDRCITFVNRQAAGSPTTPETHGQIIALTKEGVVVGAYDKDTRQTLPQALIEPELFAQYYGDTPVLRNVITISSGEVPPLCLNALISVEDAKFYEHSAISYTGIIRAFLSNLGSRHFQQGGSTLTQQLVKNYMLTPERTYKRKIREIILAFLVEAHISKDDILETYINLIYMGQNGPFEVRGFSAASQHYFGKPLKDLNLPECALLAGVLNGPGYYDPIKHPTARKSVGRKFSNG